MCSTGFSDLSGISILLVYIPIILYTNWIITGCAYTSGVYLTFDLSESDCSS